MAPPYPPNVRDILTNLPKYRKHFVRKLLGFTFDPGCLVPNQDGETDDCPSGPNCPQCGNGLDDDADGAADRLVDGTWDATIDAGMGPRACPATFEGGR